MSEFETQGFGREANHFRISIQRAREGLGKPVLSAVERKAITNTISNVFDKELSEKRIREELIPESVNFFRGLGRDLGKEDFPITPISVSRQIFLRTVYDMQVGTLRAAMTMRNRVAGRMAGTFDILKGAERFLTRLGFFYDPSEREDLKDFRDNLKIALAEEAEIYAQKVEEDPTGFLVAEGIMRLLVTHSKEIAESYEYPELIAYGARLGANTYKRMYPIVQKDLSSGR